MIVIADTREQDVLSFGHLDGVSDVIRQGLDFGDYGAIYQHKNGIEERSPIFFERKSLPDLWGTLTDKVRHERFVKKVKMAREVGAQMILAVEATDQDIWDGFERSKFAGPSMLKMVQTLWVKYDLYPMLCSSRSLMAWRMVDLWSSWARNWEREK